jgi:hypothetical protein
LIPFTRHTTFASGLPLTCAKNFRVLPARTFTFAGLTAIDAGIFVAEVAT